MPLLPVDIVEHDNGSENNMISINCIALPAQALIKKHSKEENLTIPDGIPNFVHSVQKTAVQELLTVIAHATTLFISMFAEKEGLIASRPAINILEILKGQLVISDVTSIHWRYSLLLNWTLRI